MKPELISKAFEQTKRKLQELAKEKATFYTKRTEDPKISPTRKYSLRGVATTWQICYVLERTKALEEEDLISLEADWQWWRLEYPSSDAKPVVTTKVLEEDVLKAARTESRNVLLVYADEPAMDYQPIPLPSQLVNFVRMDNLSFHSELDDSVQATRESPGKRKAMSDDNQDNLVTGGHARSPPFDRDHASSDDSLYPNPPDYDNDDDTPPSPTLMQQSPFRTLKPKTNTGTVGSSDDTIPISLRQAADPTHNHTALDRNSGMEGPSQEMQERGGGASLLQSRPGEIKDEYVLGDYVPEINMDDDDDDDLVDDVDETKE